MNNISWKSKYLELSATSNTELKAKNEYIKYLEKKLNEETHLNNLLLEKFYKKEENK